MLWCVEMNAHCLSLQINDVTCESVPVNSPGCHFWPTLKPGCCCSHSFKSATAPFLKGGKPTKTLVKNTFVETTSPTPFGRGKWLWGRKSKNTVPKFEILHHGFPYAAIALTKCCQTFDSFLKILWVFSGSVWCKLSWVEWYQKHQIIRLLLSER